jgi:SAM-dependent methyltransferase
LGLARQFDAFLDEKFAQLREHHGSPILDFGAGTCLFTVYLRGEGFDVTAVVNQSRFPEANLHVLQERDLPFAAATFATTVSHFVLHHIRDQDAAFRELVRVTRGTIVVSEDVADSWLDALFHRLHTGTSPWSRAWGGFRSTQGWRAFFARFPVQIVSETVIPRWRTLFYPVRRVVFVLRVLDAGAASS